jgi:hypothetical protein
VGSEANQKILARVNADNLDCGGFDALFNWACDLIKERSLLLRIVKMQLSAAVKRRRVESPQSK